MGKKVKISEHVSLTIFQRKLPTKCVDSRLFTIPFTIGGTSFPRAMLDLGASINVIPYSLYTSLDLGTLCPTAVVIQLADRSTVSPREVVEDSIVNVGGLYFPAYFYVLDMTHDNHDAPILLGRLFRKTARTKI
ncbi:uncharacterized protein LOC141619049 [Silene latifolia]|uniref:uncharacterized protein LOC141619049 n=1 Tax=Silene latifolia TaxID=37657 RepID=UPI003D788306